MLLYDSGEFWRPPSLLQRGPYILAVSPPETRENNPVEQIGASACFGPCNIRGRSSGKSVDSRAGNALARTASNLKRLLITQTPKPVRVANPSAPNRTRPLESHVLRSAYSLSSIWLYQARFQEASGLPRRVPARSLGNCSVHTAAWQCGICRLDGGVNV